MIGKFIDLLNVEEEDRLLTKEFVPFVRPPNTFGRNRYKSQVHRISEQSACLVERAILDCANSDAYCDARLRKIERESKWGRSVMSTYDDLCTRFTPQLINTLIRNRILRNRLNRHLAEVAKHGIYAHS